MGGVAVPAAVLAFRRGFPEDSGRGLAERSTSSNFHRRRGVVGPLLLPPEAAPPFLGRDPVAEVNAGLLTRRRKWGFPVGWRSESGGAARVLGEIIARFLAGRRPPAAKLAIVYVLRLHSDSIIRDGDRVRACGHVRGGSMERWRRTLIGWDGKCKRILELFQKKNTRGYVAGKCGFGCLNSWLHIFRNYAVIGPSKSLVTISLDLVGKKKNLFLKMKKYGLLTLK